MKKQEITILYEDAYICVCKKIIGIPCESKQSSQIDMVKLLKKQYFMQNQSHGEPYIALVHRLDQPIGGVMVFARDKKAAADLSSQIRNHTLKKQYLAIVTIEDHNIEHSGHFEDYLIKDEKTNVSLVVKKNVKKAKLAILDYKILQKKKETALVKIDLTTGRHHQIRVQMAAHHMPLLYDRKYNPIYKDNDRNEENIALHAYSLSFLHPITKKRMEFIDKPWKEPFTEWTII